MNTSVVLTKKSVMSSNLALLPPGFQGKGEKYEKKISQVIFSFKLRPQNRAIFYFFALQSSAFLDQKLPKTPVFA